MRTNNTKSPENQGSQCSVSARTRSLCHANFDHAMQIESRRGIIENRADSEKSVDDSALTPSLCLILIMRYRIKIIENRAESKK